MYVNKLLPHGLYPPKNVIGFSSMASGRHKTLEDPTTNTSDRRMFTFINTCDVQIISKNQLMSSTS